MIAALLGWSGLPQWALDLIALGLVAGGVWLWHHETYESGIRAEVAKVEQRQAVVTAQVTAKALAVERSHDQELEALRDYRATHLEQPVRLCNPAPSMQTAQAHSGAKSASTIPAVVQPVHGGDSGVRPTGNPVDIGPMLEAFSASADRTLALAREFQSRDAP